MPKMSDSDNSTSNFAAFAAGMRQSESTNNYSSLGPDPKTKKLKDQHFGAYQLGYQALADAGFIEEKGDLTKPAWTSYANSLGVNSVSSFISNKSAQDIAFVNFTKANLDYLKGYQSYIGKTIRTGTVGNVDVTESGLLAAAHLVGHHAVEQFLSSNGKVDGHDDNLVHVSEYMAQFTGYGFTYDAKTGKFIDAPEPTAMLQTIEAERDAAVAYRAAHKSRLVNKPGKKLSTRSRGTHHSYAPVHGRAGALKPKSHERASVDGDGSGIARPNRRGLGLQTENRAEMVSLANGTYLARTSETHNFLGYRIGARAGSSSGSMVPNDGYGESEGRLEPRLAGGTRIVSVAARGIGNGQSFAPTSFNGMEFTESAIGAPSQQKCVMLTPSFEGSPHRVGGSSAFQTGFSIFEAARDKESNETRLSRVLDNYFLRQARLPPVGGSGFDPRVTPAWPGVKITG
jgi:hypothetical protein